MSSSLDSAKNAVKGFLSKDGKHDTTVHTSTSPAVTHETVDQHRHDNVINATDREIHQDHYHTTVQPVHDTQKLKEQHHFKTAPVEERKFEHGDDEEVKRRLRAEQEKHYDTTEKGATHHTSSVGGNLASEHVHHHVHENIQPVIERQTVEPHVVHTTVPVHETHHSAAKHHGTTALPAVSLEEFKSQGGSLGGREAKSEYYQGEPREGAGHVPHHAGDSSSEFRQTGHVGQHSHGATGATGTTGTTGTGVTGSHHTGHHGHHAGTTGTGLTGTDSTGVTGSSRGTGVNDTTGTGVGSTTSRGVGSTTGTSSTTKPSLIDRLNPLKDADHDGKKGLMD